MRNHTRTTHNSILSEGRERTTRRTPHLFASGRSSGLLATGLVAGALIGGGGYALAASGGKTIHGCVNNKTHALTVQKRCGKGTKGLSWNQVGPKGATGKTGPIGPQGPQGPAGGTNHVIDTAEVSGNGQLINPGLGITAQRTGVGSYVLTASGCSSTVTPMASVSVIGSSADPVVVANTGEAGLANNNVTTPNFRVHLMETASAFTAANGTTTWTALSNPVPYDNAFYLTVTC